MRRMHFINSIVLYFIFMKIYLNYFNGEFHEEKLNIRELKPFTHVTVIVKCDEPISSINGPLEQSVESFFNKRLSPMKLKCHWDQASASYKTSPRSSKMTPRVCELRMGVNVEF